jgi:hypothetical protein
LLDAVARHARRLGLALLVGAVLHASADAQVPTRDTTRTRRDSTRADSLRRGPDSTSVAIPLPPDRARADSARARQQMDSVAAARIARRSADSVKSPLARAEVPTQADIGERYRWTRDELFSSGAITLGELLGRVPGVTDFASGWIATPHTASYVGDFRRVRLFYDGVEIDPIDVRVGAMNDLAAIPMWTLEELVVERAAEELRVYMRSWRVNKTTPNTRVDVSTGDVATNSYRGFFGRRFANSGALQLAAQQYSTTDPRQQGDGNLLSIFGRLGWAKKQWSTDAVLLRTRRTRTEQLSEEGSGVPNIPGLAATRNDAYARIGYGDPEGARWLQLIASTARFVETNPKTTTTGTTPGTTPGTEPFVGDTVDSTASRAQYVITGGVKVFGATVSAAGRYRVFDNRWFLTPSARIGYDRGMLSTTAYVEQQESDSTFRGDFSARLSPFKFLAIAGSLGRMSPIEGNTRPTSTSYRGELGVRLGRMWATAGIMSLGTTVVPPPRAYDTLFAEATVATHRGTFATLRGPVWKAFGLNVVATKWDSVAYLPIYNVRGEINASTSWLSKFPSGNFHVLASVALDYRSSVTFPIVGRANPQRSDQYRSVSTLFELRLYDAVLSWQYRNVMGAIYNVIPGFVAPRAVNFYGVRWEFFN